MSHEIHGHNHREIDRIDMMNCALCGKEVEKHCSLICQKCWDKKHEKFKQQESGSVV